MAPTMPLVLTMSWFLLVSCHMSAKFEFGIGVPLACSWLTALHSGTIAQWLLTFGTRSILTTKFRSKDGTFRSWPQPCKALIAKLNSFMKPNVGCSRFDSSKMEQLHTLWLLPGDSSTMWCAQQRRNTFSLRRVAALANQLIQIDTVHAAEQALAARLRYRDAVQSSQYSPRDLPPQRFYWRVWMAHVRFVPGQKSPSL